jgi:hypothetical protein
MKKRSLLVVAFLIVRVMFSAGSVWIVHDDGPRLSSSITFKVNTKHLNQNLLETVAELPLARR